MLHRSVRTKDELGRDAKVEVLPEPVADEAARARERGDRGLPLLVTTEHRHEHLRLAQILRRVDLGHGDEAEARILELALEEHGDLLLDELIHAIEPLALHQTISTNESMTCPSTCSSMKSIALVTTSLACRASCETHAMARVARCQRSW